MLKYRRDKHGMRRYKDDHRAELSHVDIETAYVMKTLLKVDILTDIEKYRCKEEVNMCKAFDDMLMDERAEGRAEAVKALVSTLKEFGCSREDTCQKLMEKMKLSIEVAQEYVDKYWES